MTGELPEARLRRAKERLAKAQEATDRAARRRFRTYEGDFDENRRLHERALQEELDAEEELHRIVQKGFAAAARPQPFGLRSTDEPAEPPGSGP